ncbi:hypothetical protein MIR68_001016 [Amoeboaphelidium protococcarum]|nr:hypothetical protein MIR68_001016 [Amoeboaphelidium protococcarum]
MILQVTAYVVHRKDVEQYRHYPQDALDKMYYAKEIKCVKLLYDYDQAALKMDRLKSELQQLIMPLLRSDRLIQIACFQLKDGFDLYDGMLIKELVSLNGQFLRVIAYKGEQSLNVQSNAPDIVQKSTDTVDTGDSSTKTKKKSKKKRQKISAEDTVVPKEDDVVPLPSLIPVVQQSNEAVKDDSAEVDAELQKKLAKKQRKRKRKLEQEQQQVQAEEPKVATAEKPDEAPKAKRKKEKKSKSSKPVTPTPTPPQEQPQQSMFVMVSDEDVSPQIAVPFPDVNESVAQPEKVIEKPVEMDIDQPSLQQSSNDNQAPTQIQNVDEPFEQHSPPVFVEEPQIEMEVEQATTEDRSAETTEEDAPLKSPGIAGDTAESMPDTEKEAAETPVPVVKAPVKDDSSKVDTTDQEVVSHETADHGEIVKEDDVVTNSVDIEPPQTLAQEVSAQKEVVSSPTQQPLDVPSDSSDDDSYSSDSTTSSDDDDVDEEDDNVTSKINTGGNTLRVSFPNDASTPITLPVQLNSTSTSITKLPTLSDIKFSFPPVTVAQNCEIDALSKVGTQDSSSTASAIVKEAVPVADKKSEDSDDDGDDGMSLLLKQQQKAVTPPASQQKKRVRAKKVKDQPAPVKQK